MSENGAYEDDMRRFSRPDDRELDRVLAGETVPDNEELDELAAFVRATRVTFSEAPDERTEARHVQAMMAEASKASDNQSPVEEPVSGVSPRRRLVLRNPIASLTAKLVLAGVLALGVFAGAASAGKLPDGVQAPVSDVAGTVGVSIPTGDENNVDDGQVNNTDDGQVNNTDDGQQGNTDDGQQNNVDEGAQNNTDDGQQNNTDDGQQNNTDDGQQGNTDDGQQNNTDDTAQNNTDDGQQNDHQDQGSQGQGSGGGSDQGNQGDGNN